MRGMLGDRVKDVRISNRLKSNPVCLTVEGDVSLEMEKVMNSMPVKDKVKSERILEINSSHPVFESLKKTFDAGDDEKLRVYTSLLYDQALIIEGLPLEDPVAFSKHVSELMN